MLEYPMPLHGAMIERQTIQGEGDETCREDNCVQISGLGVIAVIKLAGNQSRKPSRDRFMIEFTFNTPRRNGSAPSNSGCGYD